MLTTPQVGDRGGEASSTRGSLYQLLLGPTDTRVNSHMVAPTSSGRGHQLQVDIDKLPTTKVKLKPRLGSTIEWNTELLELAANLRLTQVIEDQGPPTQADVATQFAKGGVLLSSHELYRIFGQIADEWWHKNTVLYYVVRHSIDLSGAFFESDTRHIRERFWIGDQRDGNGLLRWALTHGVNSQSVMAQSQLLKEVQQMKLTANPTYDAFAEHCTILLQKWRQIQTNSIAAPASFYYLLLDSIPDSNDASKLGKLRSHLADKMADMDPSLVDVVEFVNRFCQRALNIGLSHSPGQTVNSVIKQPDGAKKKCKHCSSRICRSPEFGGTIDKCITCTASIPIPKSATDGQRDFILQGRDYLKVTGKSSLKGVKPAVIREWKIGISKRPAVNLSSDNGSALSTASAGADGNTDAGKQLASASGKEAVLAEALQMLLATEALKGGDATNAAAGFGRAGAQQSVNMMRERGAGSMPFLGMHVVAWSSGSNDGTATDDSETTGDNFRLPGTPTSVATSVDAEPVLANAPTFTLEAVSGQCGLTGCLHCASDYQDFATAADQAAAIDLWTIRYAECVASRAIAFGLAEYIATEEEKHYAQERAEHIAKCARLDGPSQLVADSSQLETDSQDDMDAEHTEQLALEPSSSGNSSSVDAWRVVPKDEHEHQRCDDQLEIPCVFCMHKHGSEYICAPSVGMLSHPPPIEKGGCGKSSHELACNCTRMDYFAELSKRRALASHHQLQTAAAAAGPTATEPPFILVGAAPASGGRSSSEQGGLADIPEAGEDNADAFSDAVDDGIDDALNVQLDNRFEQLENRLQDVIAKSISVALDAGSAPSVSAIGANVSGSASHHAAADPVTGPTVPPQPPGSAGTPGVHFRTGQRLFQTPVPDTRSPAYIDPMWNTVNPAPRSGLSPLDAFRGGMLGAWYGQQQGGLLPQRPDLNDQSSTESSRSVQQSGPQPGATWPGAGRTRDDPAIKASANDSAGEHMARAQLTQATQIKKLQAKIVQLQAGTLLSRLVAAFKSHLKRGAGALLDRIKSLDGKSLTIIVLATALFGPHYAGGVANAFCMGLRRVVMDFFQTLHTTFRVKLVAILHGLLIRVGMKAVGRIGSGNASGVPPASAPPMYSMPPMCTTAELLERVWSVDEPVDDAVIMRPDPLESDDVAAPITPGFLHPFGVRVSKHVMDPTAMLAGAAGSAKVLCDDGATIDCSVTGIGRLPGTLCKADACSISIGDANSALQSNGSYYHALYRYDAAGRRDTVLLRMADTPNGIADIFSEAQEVDMRNTTITWRPREGRKWHTQSGTVLALSMTPNRLGWLRVEPVTDKQVIGKLLSAAPDAAQLITAHISRTITPHFIGVECSPLLALEPNHALMLARDPLKAPSATELSLVAMARRIGSTVVVSRLNAPTNPLLAPTVTSETARTGVSMGRAPQLTGVEILRRTHVILGHAPWVTVINTLRQTTGLRASVITKADIETVIREGCGICEVAKMRRRAFTSAQVRDKTPPPVGKIWGFDTLSLRVPAAETKEVNLTRFVNILASPLLGKNRTYAHKLMDSASIEGIIQEHRAFVRPIHGEIWAVKMDSHPTHRGHQIADFLIDSGVNKRLSPPYVHEGVGEIEVTWQWDVPAANCLLLQSKPDGWTQEQQEAHFKTAFFTHERAKNQIIPPGGRSRDMIFYDTDSTKDLLCMMAYGAPVKFLVHPEIRDSKFDEHAVAGVYRGPSRDDESPHRCLVSTGSGALLRHVTVDVGCMRVDERAIMDRMDRNHPSIQPFALTPPPQSSAPDFSRWLNPGLESYKVLDTWTASSPLPTSDTVVIIGAGNTRDGDVRDHLLSISRQAGHPVHVIVIDKAEGGYEHDWTVDRVNSALCALVAHPHVRRVVFSFPCSGWSALLNIQPGPPVLFNKQFPLGVEDDSGQVLGAALAARNVIDKGLLILAAAAQSGTELLGESPPSRGKDSPFAFKEKIYHDHVSQWEYPPMAEFLNKYGLVAIYADQGAAGAKCVKTSEMRVTQGLLPAAEQQLGTLVDKRLLRAAATSAVAPEPELTDGKDLGWYSNTATYTSEFARRIAVTVLSGLGAGAGPVAKVPTLAVPPAADADQVPELPASLQRPRRVASDAHYKDGRLVQLVVSTEAGVSSADHLADPVSEFVLASVVGQSVALANHHEQRSDHGLFDCTVDLSDTVDFLMLRCPVQEVCCVGGPTTMAVCASVASGVVLNVDLDTGLAHTWHVPKNEREYTRSPQKALWRTAQELKMEEYRSLNMFKLIRRRDVPAGAVVYPTLWARAIKFEESIFQKLNPRWCIMGGSMDRNLFHSFADTVRWTSVCCILALRASYDVVDFHFDVKNAFQATRTDDSARAPKIRQQQRRMYHTQAPGHVELDEDGVPYVCESFVAQQGAIDAAHLFGHAFTHDILADLGVRRSTWDRELWILHYGPAISDVTDLVKILAACRAQKATASAPAGWAVFGRHVDDGLGVASSWLVVEYIQQQVNKHWDMKLSRWTKLIGFDTTVTDSDLDSAGRPQRTVVTVSAIEPMRRMFQHHVADRMLIRPRHPYPSDIDLSPWGEAPPEGSPEHAEFLAMQVKASSGIGWSIWGMRAHIHLVYPTSRLCGHMANLSYQDYKIWQHSIMYELAHPNPLTFGGFPKQSLSVPDAVICPFTSHQYELGLHYLVDASLGYPRPVDGPDLAPIAAGTTNHRAKADSKSITGILGCLAGGHIGVVCQRQQLVAPDSHFTEIHAAGTAVYSAVTVAGTLQECGVLQLRPTPIFCDSQSTVFVANDAAAIKKSIWVSRRAAVLRDAVDQGEVNFIKIDRGDNVADYLTRANTHAELTHFMEYLHPIAHMARWAPQQA